MAIPVKYAEMNDAIFVGGKNLGPKLDPKKTTGLILEYDRQEKELLVTWNNETMHFLNPKGYVPGQPAERKETAALKTTKPHTAQVESPMSHVHAGPGAGKTRS